MGRFLWSRLQTEAICKEKTEQDVKNALKDLPGDLDDTYSRMLDRLKEKQTSALRALAFRCFRFVLNAARPLSIIELRDAVAMLEPVLYRKDLNLYNNADIVDSCGGFLVEDKDRIVRPIHFSIWPFLRRELRDMHGNSVLDHAISQNEFATACILYLQLDFRKDGPCQNPEELYRTIQDNPFCFFASQYFDYHIAQMTDVHISFVDFFNKLLAGGDGAVAAILQIRLLSNPFDKDEIKDGFDKKSYPVNPATMLYTTRLRDVHWLTRKARWPVPQPPKLTIHNAAAAGRMDVIIQFVKEGVNVNTIDENGVQPLYYACRNGHYTLASVLIANKADVNHVNTKGNPPDHSLHAASLEGHASIVKMLLHSGSRPNLKGGHYGSALIAACHSGKIEIVQLLLSYSAAINSSPTRGFAALHEAVISGWRSLVELLLDEGADVNETVNRRSALLVAVESRKASIAALLIVRGADVNTSHPKDGTALHIAIKKGEKDTAKLLLQSGADYRGTENWVPVLHAAVEIGNKDLVRLLLDNGADVNEVAFNDVAERGATALSIASQEGLEQIGQLLIEKGADLEAQGTAALEWAAFRSHVDVVKLLLDHGVDVNDGNALAFAAASMVVEDEEDIAKRKSGKTRIEDTIELLLQHGADLVKYGDRALRVAAARGNERITQLLTAKGANSTTMPLQTTVVNFDL